MLFINVLCGKSRTTGREAGLILSGNTHLDHSKGDSKNKVSYMCKCSEEQKFAMGNMKGGSAVLTLSLSTEDKRNRRRTRVAFS